MHGVDDGHKKHEKKESNKHQKFRAILGKTFVLDWSRPRLQSCFFGDKSWYDFFEFWDKSNISEQKVI